MAIPYQAIRRTAKIMRLEVNLKKFLLRKRVISAVLTAITSILLATCPERSLKVLQLVYDHIIVLLEPLKHTIQTELE